MLPGLIVMDAAGREFHALGERTLRYAIEHAAELEEACWRGRRSLRRGVSRAGAGEAGHSLLFLIDDGEWCAVGVAADSGWWVEG